MTIRAFVGLLRRGALTTLLSCAFPGSAALFGQLNPTLVGGLGANSLLAGGADIKARTGMSNYLGTHITLGSRERAVHFRPTLNYAWAYYRTRLNDFVDHRANRSALQLDLVVGLRAGEYGAWMIGPFAGAVLSSSSSFQERAGTNAPSFGQQMGSMATTMQAGAVVGYSVQLGSTGKWEMDLRIRQHLIGLVQNDQWYTVSNGPQALLLTTTSRPLEMTIGLGWRIGAPNE